MYNTKVEPPLKTRWKGTEGMKNLEPVFVMFFSHNCLMSVIVERRTINIH